MRNIRNLLGLSITQGTKIFSFFKENQLQINILFILIVVYLLLKETAFFKYSLVFNFRAVTFLLWFLAVLMMPLKSHHSFLLALVSFWAGLFLEKAGVHFWALRLVSYTYYFFLVGAFQYLYETYKEKTG